MARYGNSVSPNLDFPEVISYYSPNSFSLDVECDLRLVRASIILEENQNYGVIIKRCIKKYNY